MKTFSQIHPTRAILLSYLLYALIGWFILMLPVCQIQQASILDHFFTAMSAMSTTGLSTLDIGKEYSLCGQIVILLMIQTSGIVYMTFNTFVILTTCHTLSEFKEKISSNVFSLPKEFNVSKFIFHAIIFTFACELLGAIALSFIFMNHGVESYIWNGIFHSVSSFCTAGFSLFPTGLMNFKYDIGLNAIISILCILGSVGFITWLDFYKRLTRQKKHLIFTTKIILLVTFGFLFLGTLLLYCFNSPRPTDSAFHSLLTSFFQVMSASSTVGFHTLDIGSLKTISIVLLLFLMLFGAAPAGTGGGLKSTTFSALLALIKSYFKKQKVVSIRKREIPHKRLQLAITTFTYYALLSILSVWLLYLFENKPFLPLIFEVASALGTVGLSMGITSDLTDISKLLISFLMFLGKIGILTFGIALTSQNRKTRSLALKQ